MNPKQKLLIRLVMILAIGFGCASCIDAMNSNYHMPPSSKTSALNQPQITPKAVQPQKPFGLVGPFTIALLLLIIIYNHENKRKH